MFFTNETGNPLSERQTAVTVDIGPADDHGFFLLDRQALYGAGGANLAAEGAQVFAVTDARDHPWGKQTFDTGLGEGRMNGVADTDLHAFAAAHAAAKELCFRQGPGGPDKAGLWLLFEGTDRKQKRYGDAGQYGTDEGAATEAFGDGRGWILKMAEAEVLLGATGQAIEA